MSKLINKIELSDLIIIGGMLIIAAVSISMFVEQPQSTQLVNALIK